MKIFGRELTFNGFKIYHAGDKPTKSDVGLGNVENKSSEAIRNDLTKNNVVNALGYVPVDQVTVGSQGPFRLRVNADNSITLIYDQEG